MTEKEKTLDKVTKNNGLYMKAKQLIAGSNSNIIVKGLFNLHCFLVASVIMISIDLSSTTLTGVSRKVSI